MVRKQELIQNNQCFIEFGILTKNDIIQGQASWNKMTSPGGKLIALACQLTKKVNKAEELTYSSTSIAWLTKTRSRHWQMERKHEFILDNQCFIEFGILTKNDIIQGQASRS
jgi:hypothetical protein